MRRHDASSFVHIRRGYWSNFVFKKKASRTLGTSRVLGGLVAFLTLLLAPNTWSQTQTLTLTLNASGLKPCAGSNTDGAVILGNPAPVGGATIDLSSDNVFIVQI